MMLILQVLFIIIIIIIITITIIIIYQVSSMCVWNPNTALSFKSHLSDGYNKHEIRLMQHAIPTATPMFLGLGFPIVLFWRLRLNRNRLIQDGGLQTWNSFISACAQENNDIPEAMPIYSEILISLLCLSIWDPAV